MKQLFLGIAIIVLLTGCQEITQIKEDFQETYQDLEKKIGETVTTIDAVNSVVTEEAKEVIDLIKQFDFKIQFKKNGVSFSKGEEIEGMIGLNQNTVFLQMEANTDNADTVQKFIQIAVVFSDGMSIEQRINQVVEENKSQRFDLENGYIVSDGQQIEIYIEGITLPQ